MILKTDMAQKGKIFTLQKNVHSPVAHNILNLISSRKTETFILVPTLRFSIVYVSWLGRPNDQVSENTDKNENKGIYQILLLQRRGFMQQFKMLFWALR